MCNQKLGGVIISPRTGRPTENPRNNNTRIRMSDEEVEMLNYCSEKTGKTKTDIIVEGITRIFNDLKGEKK